ncbi:ATP-binding protein [Gulosibacter faecalis]|jgi:GNAT superfamily N-acetyltransferase|uniref:ATP-binding protein n=1 Tax=Gulosibacter faecalis TaxID=272240 RepID=A0ABW5UXL9_9MICO|nr:bifunctional GNAT family N-acetyltransferase/ATP-binding protein [Gulosibacter faecalis]
MTQWRIRDLQPTDLDGFLRLWEEYTAAGVEPVYSLNEVLASTRADTAVVAVVGDEVVGATVARAAHDQAWIVFFAVDARWRRRGISGAMLSAVERRLASQGIHRVSVLVPDGEEHVGSLTRAGFADKRHLRYFERTIPIRQEEVLVLRELGGRMLGRDRWDSIGGMRHEKQVLERRLVLPLADPDLADQFGVVPPRAIVLFGPPGTGKTTFAKGIASRLEWPFVEVFPSRLAASPKGLAGELRETFEKIDDLDHAVVFIDEVEEIAVRRGGEPPSPMQGVTNELLKIIPAFRDKPGRLLICATNFIRALDPAFLRHGRFDYVIPIGLPDAEARRAIWQGFVPASAGDALDFDALVEASEGFSPADIEFASRSASQSALERAVSEGGEALRGGPTQDDFLAATRQTRTTVSREVAAEFEEDIASIARL